MRAGWLVLGVAGCAPCPELSEVPIRGASDAQHGVLTEALASLEQALGPGRVCIPEVALEPLGRHGSVERHRHRIRLDSELSLDDLDWVLTHEVAHAVDFGEGLAATPDPLLDRVADEMFAHPTFIDPEARDGYGSERLRRSEVVATFASSGPAAATLQQVGCAGDPVDAASLATWQLEQLWWYAVPYPSVPPGPVVGRWESDAPVEALAPSGASVRLEAAGEIVTLDLGAGASVEAQPAGTARTGIDAVPVGPTVSGSRAAQLIELPVHHLGEPVRRVLWSDGEHTLAVGDGCARALQVLFAHDDRVWTAWVEPDQHTVAWGPLVAW